MNQDNRRVIILSIGIVSFLLVIGLIGFGVYVFANRGPSADELAIDANPPTITPTNTLVPSPTPTNTATPTPTNTPTPTPTATPQPLELTITGPKFVPQGLPVQVEWRIEPANASGVSIVSLEDLGGSMAIGDGAGNVVIARTIAQSDNENGLVNYDEFFTLSAIIDPNVNQGIASFLIDNNITSETVTLPWIATDRDDIESQTFTIVLDGFQDDILTTAVEEVEAAAESIVVAQQPGYEVYQTSGGLQLEYPDAWFIQEFPDGTTQISENQIPAADGLSAVDSSYALVLTGSREDIGIPADIDLTKEAVLAWLLGNLSTGGDGDLDLPVIAESGLEIVSEYEIPLRNGETMNAVEMISGESEDQPPFKALFAVYTAEEGSIILTAYAPVVEDDPRSQFDIFNIIGESFELVEAEESESS